MVECENCCTHVTRIFYLIFTFICLTFNILAFTFKPYNGEQYIKYITSWKLPPISSISIDYNNLNKALNSENNIRGLDILKLTRIKEKYNYNYLRFTKDKSSNHICGLDLEGNFLYLPNDVDCPINYIKINNEKNPKINESFNFNTLKIADNLFLHYSNNNLFGHLYNNISLLIEVIGGDIFRLNNNLTLYLFTDNYFGSELNSDSYLQNKLNEKFYFSVLFYQKEIRIAINSISLFLLLSETVIYILLLNFNKIFFLYLLNIFIFIIEFFLELFLIKYLPDKDLFSEEEDKKRLYNFLLTVFLFPLFICYSIDLSIIDPIKTDPYLTINKFFVQIFCFCTKHENNEEKIEEIKEGINKLSRDIELNKNKLKELDDNNKDILKDIGNKKQNLNALIKKEKEIKINLNRIINEEKKFEEKKDENIKKYNDIIKEIENVEEKINYYKMILFKEKIYKDKNL